MVSVSALERLRSTIISSHVVFASRLCRYTDAACDRNIALHIVQVNLIAMPKSGKAHLLHQEQALPGLLPLAGTKEIGTV